MPQPSFPDNHLEFPGKQAGYRAGVRLRCWAARPPPAGHRGRHRKISDQGRRIAAPRALHGAATAQGYLVSRFDDACATA